MNCVTDINLYTTEENISHVTNNILKISLTMFYYIDSNTMYKVKQKQDDQILKCQILVLFLVFFVMFIVKLLHIICTYIQ